MHAYSTEIRGTLVISATTTTTLATATFPDPLTFSSRTRCVRERERGRRSIWRKCGGSITRKAGATTTKTLLLHNSLCVCVVCPLFPLTSNYYKPNPSSIQPASFHQAFSYSSHSSPPMQRAIVYRSALGNSANQVLIASSFNSTLHYDNNHHRFTIQILAEEKPQTKPLRDNITHLWKRGCHNPPKMTEKARLVKT